MKVIREEGDVGSEAITYERNKSLLKIHGRAAVIVPDNVLFEGGAR